MCAIPTLDMVATGKRLKTFFKERHISVVKKIMFYVGVCRVKSDPDLIEKAGTAIMNRYTPLKATLFADEGVHYYIFYLQCLLLCLKQYRNHSQYEQVKAKVSDRCMNLKLMLGRYTDDPYIANEVKSILMGVSDLEVLFHTDREINS